MKPVYTLILLAFSTPVLATLPPFTPQSLEAYKETRYQQARHDQMSRLRVNLAVSSNNDWGKINVSNFTLCSTNKCWKVDVNKHVPVVNSSTTRGQLIADVLMPNNTKIKQVFFESTTGRQSIQGKLKFEKALNIDPEYQGQNLYIVLDKLSNGNGFFRYFPVATTALPFNPKIKYYLIDPKFDQQINLSSKTSITFPANFLPHPQLFFIAEHYVGDRFPMLDIYPYISGKGNLKIRLAEVGKGLSTTASHQAIASINYAEILSPNTRVFRARDSTNITGKKSP